MKIQAIAAVLALLCAAVPAHSAEDVAVRKFLLKGAAASTQFVSQIAVQKDDDGSSSKDDTKDHTKDDKQDDTKDDKKDKRSSKDDDDDDKGDKKDQKKRSKDDDDDDDDKDKKKKRSKDDDDDDDDDKDKKKRRSRTLDCSGRNIDGFCTKSKNADKKFCVDWEDKCKDEGKKLKKEDEDLCLELGFCIGVDSVKVEAKKLVLKGATTKNFAVNVAVQKEGDDDDDKDSKTRSKDDDDDDKDSKTRSKDDDDDDKDSKTRSKDDDDDDDKDKKKSRSGYDCSDVNDNGFCTEAKNEYSEYCQDLEVKCEEDGKTLDKEEKDLCKEAGFCVYESNSKLRLRLSVNSA